MSEPPRILLVSHALGGGVERHLADLRLLLAPFAEVELLRPAGAAAVRLEHRGGVALWRADDWPALVEALRGRGYSRIHVHHVHGFAATILDLPMALQLPYDLTLHDFYPFCPLHSLSTAEGIYCGEPDEAGCAACTAARPHAWDWTIGTWRAAMRAFLANAARVIVPSAFVAARIERHFPGVAVELRPHPPRADWLAPPQRRIKVVLLGGLARVKGLQVLLACASAARAGDLPLAFCLLGFPERAIATWPDLPIQVRGEYADSQLPELLDFERADLLWFPGQIPETYSYTLDVALGTGLPIVASDLGAIGERLRGRAGCVLLPAATAAADWNAALMAAASAAAAPSSWPDPVAQNERRLAYARYLMRPLADASALPQRHDSGALLVVSAPEAAHAERSLDSLFEHGVVCGQRESRLALQQRLREIDGDYAVLAQYSARAGKPWFDVLEEVDRDRQLASARFDAEIRLRDERNAALQGQVEGLQGHVAGLQAQVGGLQAELGDWQERAGSLQLQVGGLETQLGGLQAEVGGLQAQASDLGAQCIELRAGNGALQVQLDQRGRDLSLAVAQIRRFETSTSWRLTAPLRLLGRVAKASRDSAARALHRCRWAYQRLPLALQILRDQGPRVLQRRVADRLRGQAYSPVAAPVPVVAEIGALALPTCAEAQTPRVSIVIPVYGQHKLSFNCLVSLAAHTALAAVEIIVVDDASPEPAADALRGVSGLRLLRNATNLGFIGSCQRGAELARGEFLVMLNNDIQVTAEWLEALLEVFVLRSDAGLVGARLVYPDGRLQEAGGIVWRDGSAWNWGRGDDPERPCYRYLRAVDYCSGACLVMRRVDWIASGGFDRAYAPAYYEDADLAFRVRAMGKRVYYQPDAMIIHYEGASSGTDETQGVKRHQVINREVFLERWRPTLAAHRGNGVEPGREADRGARSRVLVVEACMITPDQDAGSVRMQAMLELMLELGCKVSFIADNLEYRQPYARALQQAGVEVWHSPYVHSVAQFLEKRGGDFDTIVLCRHYIAAPYMSSIRQWAPRATIVFDTVDLHYLRETRQAELERSPTLQATARRTRAQELDVINRSDLTLVVSSVEQTLLAREAPAAAVRILSLIHEPRPSGRSFGQRQGLLFIGGFRHPPNADAMLWFVAEVWPLVRQHLPQVELTIVGSNMPEQLHALAGPGIVVAGFVERVEPLLDRARISLAPLRYGAGIKGKIIQAAACGLPVVATSVASEGTDLEDGQSLLVADTAADFASAVVRLYGDEALWNRLAASGREQVRRHFSRACARETLRELLRLAEVATIDAASGEDIVVKQAVGV